MWIVLVVLLSSVILGYYWSDRDWKNARSQASLCYHATRRVFGSSWSRIGNRSLILGPQPLVEFGEREALRVLGVTRVFGLVERHERQPGLCATPVTEYGPGVAVRWYDLEDHAALPTRDMALYDWVAAVEIAIHTGHMVYVHCRAGIGRSASLVVAYLMLAERLSFAQAYTEVRRWRPQVALNTQQQEALHRFEDWLCDIDIREDMWFQRTAYASFVPDRAKVRSFCTIRSMTRGD